MMWIHLHRFAVTKDYSFERILQQKEELVNDKGIFNCRPISYKDAWSYAQGYMSEQMREEYRKYL